MKYIELYDGRIIAVKTDAETVEEFLKGVPTRRDDCDGTMFRYRGEWFPAFDMRFASEKQFYEVEE